MELRFRRRDLLGGGDVTRDQEYQTREIRQSFVN
jgi:hypothetical protein